MTRGSTIQAAYCHCEFCEARRGNLLWQLDEEIVHNIQDGTKLFELWIPAFARMTVKKQVIERQVRIQ
ncbi:MAG: hypothetical protein CO021_05970 [Deltaproteobacteria bacterium CG_4_9_14_0_2_um_filter_42_21]|nr:MAG: hypothetical protein CO021_05970 [Deltaproteobacteria bacterium CG_4_9_14_0_2_um_filter_42_21]